MRYPDQRANHSRMPDEYLTIKEAAVETGKAEITVRRLVQRIVKGNDARNRAFLKPTPEELEQHREGPPAAWRINRKFVREHFAASEQGSGQPAPTSHTSQDDKVVSVLRAQTESMERQLIVKDEQIKSLTMLVDSLGNQLNERLREGNILMKGLQERMALPAPMPTPIVESRPAKQSAKAGASKSTGKDKSKQSEKRQPKTSWLSGLFGGGKSAS